MKFKTYELFISGISHLIFSDSSWPPVTEITESETVVKEGLLYFLFFYSLGVYHELLTDELKIFKNICWLFLTFFKLLFKYSCLHFPPPLLPPSPPIPTSHPWSYPIWFCPWVLYMCSLKTLPLFSPIIPFFPLPSGQCQFILYLNVSSSILIVCLFCWLGSTYRWYHMVFVFHHLAYFTQHNAFQFHKQASKIQPEILK